MYVNYPPKLCTLDWENFPTNQFEVKIFLRNFISSKKFYQFKNNNNNKKKRRTRKNPSLQQESCLSR